MYNIHSTVTARVNACVCMYACMNCMYNNYVPHIIMYNYSMKLFGILRIHYCKYQYEVLCLHNIGEFYQDDNTHTYTAIQVTITRIYYYNYD